MREDRGNSHQNLNISPRINPLLTSRHRQPRRRTIPLKHQLSTIPRIRRHERNMLIESICEGSDIRTIRSQTEMVPVKIPAAGFFALPEALGVGEAVPANGDVAPEQRGRFDGQDLVDVGLGLLLVADEGDGGAEESLCAVSLCARSCKRI